MDALPPQVSQRTRGRPPRNTSLRERILDAAELQISERPTSRLNLRDIAQRAGVTAALLNYHFGDVDGLLHTLLQERAQPLWRTLFDSPAAGAGSALMHFLQRWTATLLRHRWLLPCLLQAPPRGQARWGAQLLQLVQQAQDDGTLRPDLPADYITVLLLSVGALPQLAATALGCGVSMPGEASAASQLTLQHLALLQEGIGARGSRERPSRPAS